MRLLLASKSPARRATLVSAGITPLVHVSHVDEEAVLDTLPGGRALVGTTTPAEQVAALARAKCEAVVNALPDLLAEGLPTGEDAHDTLADDEDVVVVGCDSMLEIDGAMVGKPHEPDTARARIRAMRGSSGVLWTGHHAVLLRRSPIDRASTHAAAPLVRSAATTASASTRVCFGTMSDEEIDAYVASGEPLHVAGSFTIDGLGGPFIAGVDGDHHSVVGISLPLLHEMFTELGIFWPDLWDHRRAH